MTNQPDAIGTPNQTPAAALARRAEDTLKALAGLGHGELAANPAEAYAVLDHLSMVIGHTVTIGAVLADQLRQWAELCADGNRHPQAQRLAHAARLTGLGVVDEACRLYQRLEGVLSTLDQRRYRTDRGIPLDYGARR
ncbi:MAG TPA: hypothetical protein VGL39_28160 [Jatrophihabitantaceae bacterium]|jgi:hypothetical protein